MPDFINSGYIIKGLTFDVPSWKHGLGHFVKREG
jgi:hypothetical protein